MIPLAIGVGIMSLLLWIATHHYPIIRFIFKYVDSHEVIEACDEIIEDHPDPQCEAHRIAVDLKLRLEKEMRE